jgi:SAM-dependent methyltransferase
MKQCPLCKSLDTKAIDTIGVEPLVAEWRGALQIDVRAEFHDLKQIELWRCSDCCLSFFVPDSLAGSSVIYEKLGKFDWYYMPRKWEHEVALEDLNGCKNGIEIGCGFGDFVARASREKSIPFEGCEQNPSAVAKAQKNGITVHLETSEHLAKSRPGEFSAVCSFQVLEHVTEPAGFLEACCTLLQPGGKLMLGLPNGKSFLRHQFNILDMPPHHMTRWTDEVFTRLQRSFPLKLLRTAYEPLADYHVQPYVDAYASLFSRYGLRFLNIPRVRFLKSRLIKASGLQKLLRGQTIYACYVRT